MDMLALMEEATEAFYELEEQTGRTDLSDRDREIWCEAYAQGRLNSRGFYA